MNPKPHVELARPKAEKIELSAREKAAMDAATLYLPEDGTDWPKQISAVTALLHQKSDWSAYAMPTENPVCLATLAMESMGADYCRDRTTWYLRLIDKAMLSARGEFAPNDPEVRLGDYVRIAEHVFGGNPRAAEVIFERYHDLPAPWVKRPAKESPRD